MRGFQFYTHFFNYLMQFYVSWLWYTESWDNSNPDALLKWKVNGTTKNNFKQSCDSLFEYDYNIFNVCFRFLLNILATSITKDAIFVGMIIGMDAVTLVPFNVTTQSFACELFGGYLQHRSCCGPCNFIFLTILYFGIVSSMIIMYAKYLRAEDV